MSPTQTGASEAEDMNVLVEDVDLEDDTASPAGLYDELLARCKAAGIEVNTRTYEELDTSYTDIALPSGRGKRWVGASGERLAELLSIKFEKFIFLAGYEAICSYENSFIEVGLRGVPTSTQFALRRLLRAGPGEEEQEEFVLQPAADGPDRPIFRIGPASQEFGALSSLPGSVRRITLRLEDVKLSQHDQACSYLLKYSNSLLFQLDLSYGVSFMLERERIRRARSLGRRSRTAIQYPSAEYDDAPMSLYWYARSARGMPLLQFLAFYQCVEFYFPTFAQSEARRKIALLLKDPTFRADRDSDVAKLLSTISIGRSGGLGDERTQLRATVSECLNPEELRAFFEEDKERQEYFTSKPKKAGLHRIPLANPSADLRNDVADRIYNIRCKIVHTKDGDQHGDGGMILPFSEEADFLIFDIDLVEFVARKVLIATSSSIS